MLRSTSMRLPRDPVTVSALPPGHSRLVGFLGNVDTVLEAIELEAVLEWTDDFEQRFSIAEFLYAEAEGPSRWHPDDLDPFDLHEIRDPTDSSDVRRRCNRFATTYSRGDLRT